MDLSRRQIQRRGVIRAGAGDPSFASLRKAVSTTLETVTLPPMEFILHRRMIRGLGLLAGLMGLFGAAPNIDVEAGDAATELPAPAVPGPRIEFRAPVHDFGKIVGGETVGYEFVFTNRGDRLLEIVSVRPDCGCTPTGKWSRKVAPGERGVIPIEFLTASFKGPVEKTLKVTSNDPEHPAISLTVRATVWWPIEVTPDFAMLRVVPGLVSNAPVILRIENHLDEPLVLGQPESNHRSIAAELRTLTPGREFELLVRAVPPTGSGNAFGRITLTTSQTNKPTLSIPAYVVPQPAVAVSPARALLPAPPLMSVVTQVVAISGHGAKPLELSEPKLNLEGPGVALREVDVGTRFEVVMTFPVGFEIGSGRKLELSVRSNHPDFATIRVPITHAPHAPMPASATRSP